MRNRLSKTLFLSLPLIVMIGASGAGCSRQPALHDREVATRVLAEYLVNEIRPKAVLVISNPFSKMEGRPAEVYAFEEAGLQGLTKGFQEKASVKIAFPKINPPALANPQAFVPAGSKTPVSFLLAPGSFGQAVAQNSDCDLVVSLIGLPADLSTVSAWTRSEAPAFALLLPDWTLLGTPDEIRRAFQSGKLVAAVINRPGADEGTRQPADYTEAFARKFILVTKKNVDELLANEPQLFRN